jgi:PAS domain-containing protein
MEGEQRPLELILARNLVASLSTPAFLVSGPGDIIFYNEAAGSVLGRRFEETGKMSAAEWTSKFGPFDPESGEPIPLEEQPLTIALRSDRPGHARYNIRSETGAEHEIVAVGLPLVGVQGFEGAMVFFWPAQERAAA